MNKTQFLQCNWKYQTSRLESFQKRNPPKNTMKAKGRLKNLRSAIEVVLTHKKVICISSVCLTKRIKYSYGLIKSFGAYENFIWAHFLKKGILVACAFSTDAISDHFRWFSSSKLRILCDSSTQKLDPGWCLMGSTW